MKTRPAPTEQQNRTTVSPAAGRLTKLGALIALSLVALATTGRAQVIWYLHAPMAFGSSMTTPGFWFDSPTGGTAATTINSSDIYDTNGFFTRTNGTGITNFAGGTLISSSGTSGIVAIKGAGLVVNNFQTAVSGGAIGNSEIGVTFSATTMTLNGNLWLANNGALGASRTMTIAANTVTGSGDITLYGGPTGFVTLSFGNATGFTGDILSTDQGFIDFGSSFTTSGGLSMAVGTRVQDFTGITITVTSLDVGGTVFAPGTYTYAQIKATNTATGLIFTPSGGGPTGGVIVVIPEPGTGMLLGLTGVIFAGMRRKRSARVGAAC